MSTLFISDMHIGHENVIGFDDRPYKTSNEMDNDLIKRWNNKVKPGDVVYVLGDMIWKNRDNDAVNILKQLNGQIIVIKGNHDRFLKRPEVKKILAAVKDYDDITVKLNNGSIQRCILSHYYIPFYNGHRRNAIQLHGHSHNTDEHFVEINLDKLLNNQGYNLRHFNVGCMHPWMNYEPRTLDEILEYFKNGGKNG